MKIYTKTGDDATTFHGGVRVSKSDRAIECQGLIDELNSWIGLCARELSRSHDPLGVDQKSRAKSDLRHFKYVSQPISIGTPEEKAPSSHLGCPTLLLQIIQYKLFDIGAQLNDSGTNKDSGQRVTEADIQVLESAIDTMEQYLPELKNFILPNSTLHVARTVCRRVERHLAAIFDSEDMRSRQSESSRTRLNSNLIIPYINRLSDFLFVLSRYTTELEDERIWDGKKRDAPQAGSVT